MDCSSQSSEINLQLLWQVRHDAEEHNKGKSSMPGKSQFTVTNILTQGGSGDLDFSQDGNGQLALDWSFVECPGAEMSTSRRMLAT